MSRRNESGIALLFTLGILTLLLMIALSFAISSQSELRASFANSNLIRSRLLALSTLDRCQTIISRTSENTLFPGSKFSTSVNWNEQRFLLNINGSCKSNILDAQKLVFSNFIVIPSTSLFPDTGWQLINSSRNIRGSNVPIILGRTFYIIIDESGKIDVSDSIIDLTTCGISKASILKSKLDGGLMPDNFRWASLSHLIKTNAFTQSELDTLFQTCTTYSYDEEKFWRDKNNNGSWDNGEDEERLNLTSNLSLSQIYSLFLGEISNVSDDCEWIKETEKNSWIVNNKTLNNDTILKSRQKIAAQITANILDYSDNDNVPKRIHLDTTGNILDGLGISTETNIIGVDNTWGISEISMRIKTDIEKQSKHTITAFLNINPDNAPNTFFLMRIPPNSQIDRDTLKANGDTYTYVGPATSVQVKAKGTGTLATIDGQSVNLNTNTKYSILSNSMTVTVKNIIAPGDDMGHWWIQIDAIDAIIEPDPLGGKKDLTITPGFKGEVFYPFSTTVTDPGIFTIRYSINVSTATGKFKNIQGATTINLDSTKIVDTGILKYSSDYTNAGAEIVEDAFDIDANPKLDYYTITLARIDNMTLKDLNENIINEIPLFSDEFFCNWIQNGSINTDINLFARVKSIDPLMNNRKEIDPDFSQFWITESLTDLSTSDNSEVGDIDSGYHTSEYNESEVKNSNFEHLGELGRLHSYFPLRSLRFWSSIENEVGYDSEILDLFKLSDNDASVGKININTLQTSVLKGILTGETPKDVSTLSNSLISQRKNGRIYSNFGEFFGKCYEIYGSDKKNDKNEEKLSLDRADILTVRSNIFNVLICAQSIKDNAGIPYDSNGDNIIDKTSAYSQFDVSLKSDGSVKKYLDSILSEQKIFVTIYKDAYSNEQRIVQFEFINE